MSKETDQYMTWHHENRREPSVLSHPSDEETWKNFNKRHPLFAAKPRNVRLSLCTDGFTPFGMPYTTYSCCPVIMTPYNLPPWMCMKIPYMFWTLIILGPHSSKNNIDVFLEPLIDELIQLWDDGVDTYDAFRENKFKLKATLMWTLNDFRTIRMEHTCNFCQWVIHLEETSMRLLRGELRRMHLHLVMDDKDKTKDNVKSRQDVKEYYRRHELELFMKANGNKSKPKALYTLNKEQKKVVNHWVKDLKFLDGYASNLSRLLPNALREMLHEPIWKAMTEKILPPGFFDHMEHLLVHLSYKEKVGGPVQYLYHLKKKVKNKARVESSICEAYIMEEISNFCTHYFKSHVQTNSRKVGQNDDGGSVNMKGTSLYVFNYRGRPSGTCKRRYLDDDEYDVATFYVLHKCEEIQPFFRIFEAELKVERPNITTVELIDMTQQRFGSWFRDYVLDSLNSHMVNDNLKTLAIGPSRHARTWQVYYVNGFKFHTKHHSLGWKTSNTDICLVGEVGDYYGQMTDVIELEYTSYSKVILFRCDWFDPIKNRGWKIHNEFGLVDINHKKKLMKYDPFIIAHQALQVYFIRYPSIRKDKVDWLAVCRIPVRSIIVALTQPIEYAYQEDGTSLPFIITENDEIEQLHDVEGDVEEVELQHLEDDASEEVDVAEEDEELEEEKEEEEVEYEDGSEEDDKAEEKDEWQDNFSDDDKDF
ncbi:transposon-like protein [Tanacetum coccineum]